ncbi:MAG: EamA family transporter [Kordiimonadaceae bacterium]|nr:EamA family transporter [Kordiimonadaceae bacterium]MBO6569163.1 EamA family transporter [Kordiimonadaceae bacterium]MBO6964639.1 EamA family transporter [Kordiimonadaceae bacterium]
MKPQHTLLAILIAGVWGFNFIATKWAVEDFPPLFANGLRFLIVLAVLIPFLRVVPGKMKPLLKTAVTLGFVHFGLLFWGMSLADGVGSVAIASQLNVPFSTILAIVILKETVGLPRVAGISISFIGVMFLGFDPVIFAYWDGVLVIVAAAFMYAVCAVMMRQLKEVPATTVQAWVALAGMSGSFLTSLLIENGQVAALSSAGNVAWASVAYTALISTLIGHGGANYLFQRYEVSMVSPYFLALPFFSVAGGVALMGETVGWQMFLGGGLTILGVLIVTLRNNKRAEDQQAVQARD